jgi:hypothetical protein
MVRQVYRNGGTVTLILNGKPQDWLPDVEAKGGQTKSKKAAPASSKAPSP